MYNKQHGRERFLQAIKIGEIVDFTIFGYGSSDIALTYDADEDTTKFVTQKSGQTVNKGYTVSSDVEQIVFTDDPLFAVIDKIRRSRAVGATAQGQMLDIHLYDSDDEKPVSVSGALNNIEIVITSFAGSAEDPLSISYKVNYQGSPKEGTVAINYESEVAKYTFTEDE